GQSMYQTGTLLDRYVNSNQSNRANVTHCLNLVVGSPISIHVRRTSISLTAVFALIVASPSRIEAPANNCLNNSKSAAACASGRVNPDDDHMATAPPLGAFNSACARLSIRSSMK